MGDLVDMAELMKVAHFQYKPKLDHECRSRSCFAGRRRMIDHSIMPTANDAERHQSSRAEDVAADRHRLYFSNGEDPDEVLQRVDATWLGNTPLSTVDRDG